ncbi:MAG: undecaprenyl/decaprenyl-phosphate alpha-N-acetylglucosaminyl 1-phosphate transferase [Clostridia bacterium]|nr:undecaprenyl/decaprenyl-phosphate alpha-N-acetylglucosaminyl 1-phosphate transferase [Clostridia bacterium]
MGLKMTEDSITMFAFLLSFVVAFATTPFVKRLAYKIGAVDVPKDSRRMHKTPKARLGGLAIFLGFLVSVCIFTELPKTVVGILLGTIVIVVLGIFDDRSPLSAKFKFAIQILAAIIPVAFGVVIERVSLPVFISPTGVLELGWLGYPLTVLWIVAVTNALNLIDGLDGLAIGVATISSITLLCISLLLGNGLVVVLTAALSGACLGFFPYNFNPAKLFMGDTGALFLGFTLSTISVLGLFKGYAIISVAIPLLILALPIFDTSFAILRRIKNHKPIMAPDRGHLHHKLIDHGLTQKQAVGCIYAMCVVLCLFAIFLLSTGAVKMVALLLIVALFVVFMVITPRIMATLHDENETNDKK